MSPTLPESAADSQKASPKPSNLCRWTVYFMVISEPQEKHYRLGKKANSALANRRASANGANADYGFSRQ